MRSLRSKWNQLQESTRDITRLFESGINETRPEPTTLGPFNAYAGILLVRLEKRLAHKNAVQKVEQKYKIHKAQLQYRISRQLKILTLKDFIGRDDRI